MSGRQPLGLRCRIWPSVACPHLARRLLRCLLDAAWQSVHQPLRLSLHPPRQVLALPAFDPPSRPSGACARTFAQETKSIAIVKPEFEAPYPQKCGFQAAEIVTRLIPSVTMRPEYRLLVDVLTHPGRWHEAHDVFDSIRRTVTLVRERDKRPYTTADDFFIYIAENAAKTAFNCVATDALFDDDSYDYLLALERDFVARGFADSKFA